MMLGDEADYNPRAAEALGSLYRAGIRAEDLSNYRASFRDAGGLVGPMTSSALIRYHGVPDGCPYNPAGPCDCEVEEIYMPGFAEPVRRDHVRRADYAQTEEPPQDIPVDRTSWYASRMPPSKVTPFKPTSLIDWIRNTR